ncbi:MAG: hypothetical protein M1834_004409 [Cirrosporium novae-zelandiae]|nr:MAG: hypothetical protein M1834_004409 [Cirrosporium novae-zelandiae]
MKSRQHSPQADSVRLKTYRLDMSAELPQLQFDDVFDSTLDMNGSVGSHGDHTASNGNVPRSQSPTTLSNGAGTTSSNGDENGCSTPYKKSSTNTSSWASPKPSEPDAFGSVSHGDSHTDSPPHDQQQQQWSSAVGRATTGKSGRVIERLMGEKDNLNRECHVLRMRCEEADRRFDSAKARSKLLEEENSTLRHMKDIDKASLARRDRIIENLKADLTAEKERRVKAEKTTQDATLIANQYQEASASYETKLQVASTSWEKFKLELQSQIDGLRRELERLRKSQKDDRKKVAQWEALSEQKQREITITNQKYAALLQKLKQYQDTSDLELRTIREDSMRSQEKNEELEEEMRRILGEMKWVMNVKKDVSSAR